jgi:PAS domain-containing protein
MRDKNRTPIGFHGIYRDVTERRHTEAAFERLRQQDELILNSVVEGIFGLDVEGKATFVNPATARLLGYEVGNC